MEFLGKNEEGMRVECLYRGGSPGRPRGGRQAPFHFFSAMDLVANLKKKLHLGPVAPHRVTGGIFEIFQNGHIFLKF